MLPDSSKGASLPNVLAPFLIIIGASLGLAFSAMGLVRTHWGVWIAMAGGQGLGQRNNRGLSGLISLVTFHDLALTQH